MGRTDEASMHFLFLLYEMTKQLFQVLILSFELLITLSILIDFPYQYLIWAERDWQYFMITSNFSSKLMPVLIL